MKLTDRQQKQFEAQKALIAKMRTSVESNSASLIYQQPTKVLHENFAAQSTAQSDGTIFSGYRGAWALVALDEAKRKPSAEVVQLAYRRKPAAKPAPVDAPALVAAGG